MNEAQMRLLSLQDDRLPAIKSMLGREAVDLLGAAVTSAGATALSARPIQITWRPGRSLVVTYDVQLALGKNHRRASERFVASTGTSVPEGALLLARDDQQVAVWQMTADPALPGLAVAMDRHRLTDLLAGLDVTNAPAKVEIVAYRPGHRAVVEVTGRDYRVFLKVVPPHEVPNLQERHRILSARLPVPRSHGWSADLGLVVLEALPGSTLRNALLDPRHLLQVPALLGGLLNSMPDLPDRAMVPSATSLATAYGCLVRSALPDLSERIEGLLERIADSHSSFPAVPVHGDLHEGQVLVKGGVITGLLDVDTAGHGFRIDDWANLIGHLVTWGASLSTAARRRVMKFTDEVLDTAVDETGDPAELRLRVAAVMLGLATGPFRAQTRTWPADTRARIGLAKDWIDGNLYGRDENKLMSSSRLSHSRMAR
jgi:Phosphotransferase enzyme family